MYQYFLLISMTCGVEIYFSVFMNGDPHILMHYAWKSLAGHSFAPYTSHIVLRRAREEGKTQKIRISLDGGRSVDILISGKQQVFRSETGKLDFFSPLEKSPFLLLGDCRSNLSYSYWKQRQIRRNYLI